jgi:hypothetical protein
MSIREAEIVLLRKIELERDPPLRASETRWQEHWLRMVEQKAKPSQRARNGREMAS